MSVVELRNHLITKIKHIEDENVLEEILRLLDISIGTEYTYKLNSEERNMISEAQKEYSEGKYMTEDEADKDIDKWLEE